MSEPEEAAKLWRDLQAARVKVKRLESELGEAKMLLAYAEEAAYAEYRRFAEAAIRDHFQPDV